MKRLVGLFLLAALFSGCPDSSGSAAPALHLETDLTQVPQVGDTWQLRLRWGTQQSSMVLLNSTLLENRNLPVWDVAPPQAAKIDPATSKIKFLGTGEIVVRAHYRHQGKMVSSNPLRWTVRPKE